MQTVETIRERRHAMAEYIDKRRPDVCWAALCLWAEFTDAYTEVEWFSDILNTEHAAPCRAEAEQDGSCWCGKIRTAAAARAAAWRCGPKTCG